MNKKNNVISNCLKNSIINASLYDREGFSLI